LHDQSISIHNFQRILEDDTRDKGMLEMTYFPAAFILSKKIKLLKRSFRKLKYWVKIKKIDTSRYEQRKLLINKVIELRKVERKQIIEKILSEVVKTVTKKGYKLPLQKSSKKVGGKDVYSVGSNIETIFVSKHLQKILLNIYNIRISNRDLILSQLSTLLNDSSPKYVIRADVENFYESICHERLKKILHSSALLSVAPRRILTQLIDNFNELVQTGQGVPRGVGISAYLSEIYMAEIEAELRTSKDLSYYGRYVDDIVMVFSPSTSSNLDAFLKGLTEVVERSKLKLNDKTKEFDLLNNTNANFEYLGCKFQINSSRLTITMSNKKFNRYKKRIDCAFSDYTGKSPKMPNKSKRLLVSRLAFLTSNTRLHNSKSRAFIGIYFGNKYITNTSQLLALDAYLSFKTRGLALQKLKKRISKYSFKDGFETRKFRNFSTSELKEISQVWKNE
tara:strand:- start:2562 stop:3911 length:1350 start_codon:yes stop_codon:yes gene_type:complete